ncbi:PPOX class F420-dependent oxidoreductase [Amycolatopsis antarctica]|uniref:PPOX class F420-dependent oxidoreductase n=1 Tax=Amycolatopsis antarctica TaxID=1854586 RepID=UPI00196A4A8F|nr:PPOX class F420-dependent oxidoreductase [Amycolatopsis antarctica]
MNAGFPEALADAEFLSLTTFRRDGTPVATAVWAAPDGDRLVVWTPAASGKVRRLRHTARVTLVPCDRRGVVDAGAGEPVEGLARLLPPAELGPVRRAMTAKYGWKFREFAALLRFVGLTRLHRLIRSGGLRRAAGGPVGVEIRPAD